MAKKKKASKAAAGASPAKPANAEPARVMDLSKSPQKAAQPLTEKDRQILSEVDKIIWNPGLLNKYKADGKGPDGFSKSKKDARKV